MIYETIRYQGEPDGVLFLVLVGPDRPNAFTVTMCEELVDAYGRGSRDDTERTPDFASRAPQMPPFFPKFEV